jgi:hypothetical protein
MQAMSDFILLTSMMSGVDVAGTVIFPTEEAQPIGTLLKEKVPSAGPPTVALMITVPERVL